MNNLTIKIEKDGLEYHAWCPELKGCHTHGKTIDEAKLNLKDALNLYLDVLIDQEIHREIVEQELETS
ncbi:type II toxin-antitoxin system HicB family antitoxin [Candidatus Kapabacteria bacterium]|nr:type II toxin-antitoxin system HicB family antitoxin [Candidatus Kapabacteria bacterium]